MKKIGSYVLLSIVTIAIFGAIYPLAMIGLGNLIAADGAAGKPIYKGRTLVGYENIGQAFYSDKYFWSRPSAVDYDASATGGSNLGNRSEDLLQLVEERSAKLLESNPGLTKANIPVELVTASGSGLDPHITKQGALVQAQRIAQVRNLNKEDVLKLIDEHNEQALAGAFGPSDIVNVLKLNLALDELSNSVTLN